MVLLEYWDINVTRDAVVEHSQVAEHPYEVCLCQDSCLKSFKKEIKNSTLGGSP
jgi:hypothetical protein